MVASFYPARIDQPSDRLPKIRSLLRADTKLTFTAALTSQPVVLDLWAFAEAGFASAFIAFAIARQVYPNRGVGRRIEATGQLLDDPASGPAC
jgi:hypothetical protein